MLDNRKNKKAMVVNGLLGFTFPILTVLLKLNDYKQQNDVYNRVSR